jgi:hypothetical protein
MLTPLFACWKQCHFLPQLVTNTHPTSMYTKHRSASRPFGPLELQWTSEAGLLSEAGPAGRKPGSGHVTFESEQLTRSRQLPFGPTLTSQKPCVSLHPIPLPRYVQYGSQIPMRDTVLCSTPVIPFATRRRLTTEGRSQSGDERRICWAAQDGRSGP